MSSTIPFELRELLKQGEFLSMIPRGKKPNMHDYSFVDADSWSGALFRATHGEDRRGMVIKINTIVDQFITAIRNHDGSEFLPLIIDTLYRMKTGGLSNLLATYSAAPDTVADLRVCLSNIELQLRRFRHLLPGYRADEADKA